MSKYLTLKPDTITPTETSVQMYHITIRPPGGVLKITDDLIAFMEHNMKPARLAVCLELVKDNPTTAHLHVFLDTPDANGTRTDNLMRPFVAELEKLGILEKDCRDKGGTGINRAVVIRTIKPEDYCHRIGYIHKDGRVVRPEPSFTKPFLRACHEVYTKAAETKKKRKRLGPPEKHNFERVLAPYKKKFPNFLSNRLHACYQDFGSLPYLPLKDRRSLDAMTKVPLSWFEDYCKKAHGEQKEPPPEVGGPPPPTVLRPSNKYNIGNKQDGAMLVFTLMNGTAVVITEPFYASWPMLGGKTRWWGPRCMKHFGWTIEMAEVADVGIGVGKADESVAPTVEEKKKMAKEVYTVDSTLLGRLLRIIDDREANAVKNRDGMVEVNMDLVSGCTYKLLTTALQA